MRCLEEELKQGKSLGCVPGSEVAGRGGQHGATARLARVVAPAWEAIAALREAGINAESVSLRACPKGS